jgi:hypothetical protein
MHHRRWIIFVVAIVIGGWLVSAGLAALLTETLFPDGYRIVDPVPEPESAPQPTSGPEPQPAPAPAPPVAKVSNCVVVVLCLAGAEGLEPSTLGFGDRCSTN